MYLIRHQTVDGPRWAANRAFLDESFSLAELLSQPASTINEDLKMRLTREPAAGAMLAPLEAQHEVWASGVTYLRSREARVHESEVKDVYEKVYLAERPELFFKALGWRVMAEGQAIRIRRDSHWNVPEPELTLVINSRGEIVGYTIGNDVSSRDIEGDNPLYLPQAKIYNGSCAMGPGIMLCSVAEMRELTISMRIQRGSATVYQGETSMTQMKRALEELAACLFAELDFPHGAFLMTGAGIVPDDEFTLQSGDHVAITIADQTLENPVSS